MTDVPGPVQVVETPTEALRRLRLTPDVPEEELREAIQNAVNDVLHRLEMAKQYRFPLTFTAGKPKAPDGG